MKRVALAVAIVLCGAAGTALAGGYHHGHGYGHNYGHYRYPGRVVVAGPSVWVAPPVAYPAYRPVYDYGYYNYYQPAPSYGFYYRDRGVSIGIGF